MPFFGSRPSSPPSLRRIIYSVSHLARANMSGVRTSHTLQSLERQLWYKNLFTHPGVPRGGGAFYFYLESI